MSGIGRPKGRPKGRHRRLRHHYGSKAAATILFAFGAAVASTAWTGAAADAPVKYGWWSATNAGTPFTPPAPPDVPAKGMYVENNVSGPSAISAISFTVPNGATVGLLTLVATGSPIMSNPPMACLMPASAQGYKPAQDGAWSAKPAYDCKAGQAAGEVGSDGKTVTFPVAGLVRSGALNVAIVATGQADRIPFNAPTSSALSLTTAPQSSGAVGSSAGSGVPGSGATGSTGSGMAAAGPAAPAPPNAGSVAAGAVPDAGVPPAVAAPQTAQSQPGTSPTGSTANAAPAAASSPSHARVNAATVLGLAAMVAALLFWTEGFGILGGRIHSLAGRRRQPAVAAAYPAESAAAEPAIIGPAAAGADG